MAARRGSDATWCALAKQYSQDPSSKDKCGKATFSQGQTVPAFDKLLFSLPTKQVGKVNTPQYGWFVLQPTAAGKPAKTTPEKQVTTEIRQALLQTRKQQATSDWATGVAKRYCKGKDIAYQAGYAPSPDPCAQFVTSTATT